MFSHKTAFWVDKVVDLQPINTLDFISSPPGGVFRPMRRRKDVVTTTNFRQKRDSKVVHYDLEGKVDGVYFTKA